MRGPLIDRLLARVSETEQGCWIFAGAKRQGYGVLGRGARAEGLVYAHRAAYEYFICEIPAGLDLDHLCRVRPCCNPWHLEPVTRLVNVSRGDRAPGYGDRRTHCKWGHEYTEATARRSAGQRHCRTCERAQAIATYQARKRNAA